MNYLKRNPEWIIIADFPQTTIEPSLGDVARANRVEHAKAPKAEIRWEQQ